MKPQGRRKPKHTLHVPIGRQYQFTAEELAKLLIEIDGEGPSDLIVPVQFDRATTAPAAAEQPPRVGRTLHRLNGVEVEVAYIRERETYEIRYRSHFACGGTVHDAFRRMRSHYPKRTIVQVDGEGIVAIRAFHTYGDMLTSINFSAANRHDTISRLQLYEGPIKRADKRPTPTNHHGVYCLKLRGAESINNLINDYSPTALGFVELLEHAVEHQHGYRASAVLMRHIVVRIMPCSEKYREALADRYQCEVTIEKDSSQRGEPA